MTTNQGVCPYLNRDDERCGQRLTLVNLPQAFSFCMSGGHGQCAIYQKIRSELRPREGCIALPQSA